MQFVIVRGGEIAKHRHKKSRAIRRLLGRNGASHGDALGCLQSNACDPTHETTQIQ